MSLSDHSTRVTTVHDYTLPESSEYSSEAKQQSSTAQNTRYGLAITAHD